MNQNLVQLHRYSNLALASYSNFSTLLQTQRSDSGAVADALVKDEMVRFRSSLIGEAKRDFTEVTAAAFVSTYEVLDQFTDPVSGYSATLFRDKASGRPIWVQRGTDDLTGDLVADGTLVLGWRPYLQIVQMVNYYLRLSAPLGADVQQIALPAGGAPTFVSSGANGLGYGAAMSSFDVAGHSLGG